jgi:thermitase
MRGLAPRTRRLSIAFALTLLALLPSASFAQSEERIIVKREPGLSSAARADLRADAGAQLEDVLRLPRTEVVTVPAGSADAALARLNADPDVVYAERDQVRTPLQAPNDQLWRFLWGLSNTGQFNGTPGADIRVLDAWSFSLGAGQRVAVVDSGIDGSHDDLAGQIAPGGRNFVSGADPNNLRDPMGHGTHVSGTIAARANNVIGVVGVAPAAKVLPLRVFNSEEVAFDSRIAQAFDYAGALGIRVVNASLGGEGADPSQTLTNAIGAHPGTLYVTAAGNGGGDRIGDDNDARNVFPCEVPRPNVVCVGASDEDDQRTSFSNFGATSVDLFAPGERIASTLPADNYDYMRGTSMASPHVAGEAALLFALAPWLGTQQVKDLILGTADVRPSLSGLSVSGGRANAGAAIRRLAASDADGDRRALLFDRCPTVRGSGANGCPLPAPPAPPPAVGAPGPPQGVPAPGGSRARPLVRSLRVRVRPRRCRPGRRCRRTVRVIVTSDRAAIARVTIRRRRCAERRCRWVPVARRSRAIRGTRATIRIRSRRLVRGRYRATAVLSNDVGAGAPRRASFRIR